MSRPPESSFQHTFRTTVQRADASHSWVAGYNIPPTGFFPYPGAPQFSVAGPPSPPYSYTYRRNCGEWNASNASASAPSTAPPAMSAIASAPDNAFHRWQSAQMPHQSHTQLHNSVSSQVQRAPSRDSLSSSPCQCPSQSLPQQSPSPVSPSDSTTPSFLKPLLTALNALQTQLSCVQTDVQAAASEIRSVRNAQKRMCECISVLEGVFGVCTKKAGTKGKGRAKGKTRGRGRGKNSEVELELEPEVEEPQAEPLNACAIPDRLAAIEFAVEELLDRAGYAPSKTLLRDAATSPPPQPLVSPVLPTSTLEAGLLQKELSLQTATAHSDPREPHSPSLASFTQSLTSMSSPSSAAAPLSLPAAFEKHYADASVDACSPPSPQSECTMTSCRGGLGPGFAPVDWTSVPSTNVHYSPHSGQSAYAVQYLSHFSRFHQLRDIRVQLDDSSSSSDGVVSSQQLTSSTSQPSTIFVPAPHRFMQFADAQVADVPMTKGTAEPSIARSELQETPVAGNTGEESEAVVTSSQSELAPHTKGSISIPVLCLGPSTCISSLQDTPPGDVVPLETSAVHSARPSPVLAHIPLTSEDTSALQALPSPSTTASPDTPCEKSHPDRSGPPRKLGNKPVSPEIETEQRVRTSLSETRPCGSRQPSETGLEPEFPTKTTSPSEALPKSPMTAIPPSLMPPLTDSRRNVLNMEYSRDQIDLSPLNKLQVRMRSLVIPPSSSPSLYTLRQISDCPELIVQEDTDGDVDMDLDSPGDDGLRMGGDATHPDQARVNALGFSGGRDVDENMNTNVLSVGTMENLLADFVVASFVPTAGTSESADSNHAEDPGSQQQTTQAPWPGPVPGPSTSSETKPCPPGSGPGDRNPPPPDTPHRSSHESSTLPPSNHDPSRKNLTRDPTPTDSHGLAQDEDVWQALMLTTPVSVHSLPVPLKDTSRSPARRLHHPCPQGHNHHSGGQPSSLSPLLLVNPSELLGVPPESASPDPGYFTSRSLSPLSSLGPDSREGKSFGDDEELASYITRRNGTQRSNILEENSDLAAVGTSGRSRSYRQQWVTSLRRAASQTGISTQGGPRASLEELAQLARRKPLKIHIKVPPSLRGLKRKWHGVENGEPMEEAAKRSSSMTVDAQAAVAIDESHHGGDATIAEDGVQDNESQRVGESKPPSASDHSPADALTVQCSLSTLCASPTPRASTSIVTSVTSTLVAAEDSVPNSAPPMKRPKIKTAGAAKGKRGRGRPLKSRHGSNTKLKPEDFPRYFVTGGEVVRANDDVSESNAFRSAPAAPHPRAERVNIQGELVDEARRANKHAQRTTATNQAMKSPLSSSTKGVVSHARKTTPQNASSSVDQEPRKFPSVGEGTWPDLSKTFNTGDLQFIQCDNCDMWYHYACVGVKVGDPRLEPDAAFICPLCLVQTATHHTLRGHSECARPDCPEKNENSSDVYVVARLVGRQKLGRAGHRWLVEWEGYPMSQASWIPQGNVFGDGKRLFEHFEADALAEGLDLKQDVVILEDALNAGWTEPCDNGVYNVSP